ncbi:hypothetical protein RIF29_29238 [Crotalaria pallida]|uniref:Uncharacterized protein n=1 Tax=Crotalaria pallida TaxID=3830 RepID=A0AAN9EEF7_CROPI
MACWDVEGFSLRDLCRCHHCLLANSDGFALLGGLRHAMRSFLASLPFWGGNSSLWFPTDGAKCRVWDTLIIAPPPPMVVATYIPPPAAIFVLQIVSSTHLRQPAINILLYPQIVTSNLEYHISNSRSRRVTFLCIFLLTANLRSRHIPLSVFA